MHCVCLFVRWGVCLFVCLFVCLTGPEGTKLKQMPEPGLKSHCIVFVCLFVRYLVGPSGHTLGSIKLLLLYF